MSKQVYIDSNGNEVQVSGTVNSADMMPMSGNDSTKVATAIGDLDDLTTSVTSSLVGAVNEVNAGLGNATAKTGGTITAASGYTVRLQHLVKVNGTVFGYCSISATGTITSRATIGNIPVGFRPYINVSYVVPASSAVNFFQDRATNAIITTSGDILVGDIIIPSGQSIKEISISFAYAQGN